MKVKMAGFEPGALTAQVYNYTNGKENGLGTVLRKFYFLGARKLLGLYYILGLPGSLQ